MILRLYAPNQANITFKVEIYSLLDNTAYKELYG
jgi:hypothetical protein